jgi:hypothetical protein
MSIQRTWPQILNFFGTRIVTEPSPGVLALVRCQGAAETLVISNPDLTCWRW